MRNIITAVIISTLVFSAYSAEMPNSLMESQNENLSRRDSLQSHMFDGIQLTELQRQQMRDLMQRARHDRPAINLDEIETMHNLVTAENFDEAAVRTLTEQMAQEQVARQVEIAKVRNQMYRLLTPEQRAVLDIKYQQRMNRYRELSEQSTPLQTMNSSSSSPRSNK